MRSDGRSARRASWALASALLVSGGCGGDPNATRAVPAAGTVTYNGTPVAKGTIRLVPEVGRPASATIEGGKFTATTNVEGDGAAPGKLKVVVVATEQEPGKDGADGTTKFLVPQKYASEATTDLEIAIPPTGKTDIAIDLK